MFDPARKREAYLPRTNPLGKSERLYSRRSCLPFDRLPFFIQLSFRSRCTPGAENANSISLFRVGDDAHTLPRPALSAEQPEQRVVTDLHQSEPHRHAEHEGEGKVRHAVELEEQCRENPEQRERPHDETDNGL